MKMILGKNRNRLQWVLSIGCQIEELMICMGILDLGFSNAQHFSSTENAAPISE
jgi:hypothetical protein